MKRDSPLAGEGLPEGAKKPRACNHSTERHETRGSMDSRSDRLDRLIRDWREGDASAYRAFLSEAALRLRAILSRRRPAVVDVEDMVQECLIAMHEKRATLDPDRPVGPWMIAIARYKLADHWRRQSRCRQARVWSYPRSRLPPTNLRRATWPYCSPLARAGVRRRWCRSGTAPVALVIWLRKPRPPPGPRGRRPAGRPGCRG